MASQKYTAIFESDFDPKHKTVRKEKKSRVKVIKPDLKKSKKFKSKEQDIAVIGK